MLYLNFITLKKVKKNPDTNIIFSVSRPQKIFLNLKVTGLDTNPRHMCV